jgi:hypothetical protein
MRPFSLITEIYSNIILLTLTSVNEPGSEREAEIKDSHYAEDIIPTRSDGVGMSR